MALILLPFDLADASGSKGRRVSARAAQAKRADTARITPAKLARERLPANKRNPAEQRRFHARALRAKEML